MEEARRKRRSDGKNVTRQIFDPSQLISNGFFFLIAFVLIVICFVGQSPAGIQFFLNQTAQVRIVANFPFTYQSAIQTERLREESRQRVAPVYLCDMSRFEQFSQSIDALELAINQKLVPELMNLPKEEWLPAIDAFNRPFREESGLNLNNENLLTLIEKSDAALRSQLFKTGLSTLKGILQEGVIDDNQTELKKSTSRDTRSAIEIVGGQSSGRFDTYNGALSSLRVQMVGFNLEQVDNTLANALFHIIKYGLYPNLEYNKSLTEQRKKEAAESVAVFSDKVAKGETIIEPGTRITEESIEKLNAYRKLLNQKDEIAWGLNNHFAQRSILALCMLLAAFIFIKVGIPELDSRKIALAALVLLFNMLLIRLFQEFGQTALFSNRPTLLAILPYLAPIALGTIITTIMIGPTSAILVALMVSSLNSMMQGNSIQIFVIGFMSCLVGVFFCSDIRLRVNVVKSGALTGLVFALSAGVVGLLNEIDMITIGQQMLAAQFIGILTGIVVIGMLPVLESLFKVTTNITLLELTDFNHPLLRKLQMNAPGSYHHSLMVANLSERAAQEIGANSLLCRATALFHDIGKLAKPEYFIENQRDGINPHDEKNPNMSALILKSHVKEGVQMARQAKLPKIFIDVIQQHHGTTLIQFFYHKALKLKEQSLLPLSLSEAGAAVSIEESGADEVNFRYDGPKPQFKESAIIHLSDCIEAASRSLKKVTPQSITDFVNGIIDSRVSDMQLDECSLTMEDLKKIKSSFYFTLLNMLHNRIEYPGKDVNQKARGNKRSSSNTPIPMKNPNAQPTGNKRAAI